jgi:RNA polymerase sigma factor for flagellar operon FliA
VHDALFRTGILKEMGSMLNTADFYKRGARLESIEDVSKIWKQFKEDNSQESREKLILNYAPLVKYVAGRVSSGLPPNIEYADLVSYGIFGLIDAIEKYDPDRGIKFETYAIARIKGAIIDELRSIDWVPRSIRFKARELEKSYVVLENELKRLPNDEEVAKHMNIPLEELHQLLQQMSFISLVALDELWNVGGDKGDKVSLVDTLEDARVKDPSKTYEIEEMKRILADAINRLPEREKIVISLYYYEGLTLREIGEVLGVTESRVCQMHTKAILRLKGRLSSAKGALEV